MKPVYVPLAVIQPSAHDYDHQLRIHEALDTAVFTCTLAGSTMQHPQSREFTREERLIPERVIDNCKVSFY